MYQHNALVLDETAQKYYTHSNNEMQVNAIANLNGNEEEENSLIGHNSKGLIK